MSKTITFKYRNHRGETTERTIDVTSIGFVREPGYGYQSGWFIHGFDHDRQAIRSFSLNNIIMDDNIVPRYFTLMNV